MRIFSVLFLTIILVGPASASSCKLPIGQKLIIGCSYHCDFLYRFRVLMAGFKLGLRTQVVDLRDYGNEEVALSKVDGVLIPGGADIDPKYYLDRATPELARYTRENLRLVKFSKEGEIRDPFEYSLVQQYSSNDKFSKLPMLGICRGMQMMTVAEGIPLYLDIKTELGIPNRIKKLDRIHAEGPSLMSHLYGSRKFRGLKLHHQGLRVDYYKAHQSEYPRTKVTAFSNDNKIAEAIEYSHRPALGVQYHPEKSVSSTTFPVLKWFLTSACEYKNSMKDIK